MIRTWVPQPREKIRVAWGQAVVGDLTDLLDSITTHKTLSPIDHPDGSVTRAKLSGVFPIVTDDISNGAITKEKLADGSITPTKIDAVNLPADNYAPVYDSATGRFKWISLLVGARTFLELQDTPDSYLGQAGKFVRVKETEDGLEFTTIPPVSAVTARWTDTAVEDWPRPEHSVPWDTSTLPIDALALRWREGRYGSGVVFHHPSDNLPRGGIGTAEYPPLYLRYTAIGVVTPSETNPQMPACYTIFHYYGGPNEGNSQHSWYGGVPSGTGIELLRLSRNYTEGRTELQFISHGAGDEYFLPAMDNTGHIGRDDLRWASVRAVTVTAGDLRLQGRGDWTFTEEEDGIYVINNKTGKRYRLVLEEVK